jgi:hypothetical protein
MACLLWRSANAGGFAAAVHPFLPISSVMVVMVVMAVMEGADPQRAAFQVRASQMRARA